MPNWTKEQKDAIEMSGRNILVSAGAGSGKTAVLSERVINKLKQGVNIDELLILTFTEAASLEMKERIRKKIKENSLMNQLDRIEASYITTFDSFALSIVKKYNYLLNVSKNISIIDDSVINLKKEELLDNILEKLYKENNYDFLRLIDCFCSKDDLNIREAILSILSKLDMVYNEDVFLKNYIDNYYNNNFIDQKIKEYEKLIFSKISRINDYILELSEYIDSNYIVKINEAINQLLEIDDYDNLNLDIKLPPLSKGSSDEAKEIKGKIDTLFKELKSLSEYETKEEIKRSIYNTKDYAKVIIDIILKLKEELFKFKFENDLYEFSDIAKLAIKVLDENENVRLDFKNKFKEIMIDEYQDTNDLQELFISLIQNNNVYMVGDVKQSIYRFRNANPNLFKEKYDLYDKGIDGIKIDLNKNFRSRKEVIDSINNIFDIVMNSDFGGADYLKSHRMIFGNNDYLEKGKVDNFNELEVYNYNYDKELGFKKEEIEIFIIASDIKKKVEEEYEIFDKDNGIKRSIKYSDIVILMDRSTHFDLYKKIFEYLNIPMSIYKDESMTDSIDISIIKNIICLMINDESDKNFRYAFISVLRSYLFNMNDNEIFKYFVNNNYKDSILINKINNIKITSLKETLECIINEFDFYEKMITVGEIDKHISTLDNLLKKAESLESLGYTIYDFYEYLDSILSHNFDIKVSSEKELDGVKIMTIHKSKGLEYNLCYYSGLYSKFNMRDLNEKILYDNSYGIVIPTFDKGIRDTVYKSLLKNKYYLEEISEKIRLFYVALTRAKEKIILVCPLEDKRIEKGEYKSFLDIINLIKDRLYIKDIDLKQIPLTHNYNLFKKNNYSKNITLSYKKINVKELNIESSIVNEEHFSKENHKLLNYEEIKNIDFGLRIHSVFQNIDFKNPNYDGLNSFEKEKVKKFIESDFVENSINFYKEFEFYDDNNHGIIDLILEYEDHYKIIDYKLKNVNDEDYIKQLNGYKNYLSKIVNKKIDIYLYSIINSSFQKL